MQKCIQEIEIDASIAGWGRVKNVPVRLAIAAQSEVQRLSSFRFTECCNCNAAYRGNPDECPHCGEYQN